MQKIYVILTQIFYYIFGKFYVKTQIALGLMLGFLLYIERLVVCFFACSRMSRKADGKTTIKTIRQTEASIYL